MQRFRYSTESKEDLKQIARFIARDKPVAARQWVKKLREKCRLVAKHPDVGDARAELGEGIRSTYVGSYVILYPRKMKKVGVCGMDAATQRPHIVGGPALRSCVGVGITQRR